MKRFITSILIFCVLNVSVSATCTNPVIKLDKGEKSPCTGFLFSPKKEKELAEKIEKHKLTLEQLRLQTDINKIYKKDVKNVESIIDRERQKSEIWRKAAEDSTQKLVESESNRGRRDWIFFVLGMLATGAAAYTLEKTRK